MLSVKMLALQQLGSCQSEKSSVSTRKELVTGPVQQRWQENKLRGRRVSEAYKSRGRRVHEACDINHLCMFINKQANSYNKGKPHLMVVDFLPNVVKYLPNSLTLLFWAAQLILECTWIPLTLRGELWDNFPMVLIFKWERRELWKLAIPLVFYLFFSMNLGIVAPPKAPISRYVYAGGIGEDTR